MNAKSGREQSAEQLAEFNKKILEIKKKIQLSEGQRKALFEDCEAERKSNAAEIVKLKKEITELVVNLHKSKSPIAKYCIKNNAVDAIIGPLADRTCNEVQELLDLQIIDKTKKIDLLRYRMKQRKKYLSEIAIKYQKLLSKEDKNELNKNVDQPAKKSISELQNNIHAVDVQIREALHVKNRYEEIYKSLKRDSDNYESNINKLEEKLVDQRNDIEKLQKIIQEARRMCGIAKGHLHLEEKAANSAAVQREREAAEGRRLVSERKVELQRMEQQIFQGGKIPPRPDPEGAADDIAAEDDKSPTPPHPVEDMAQAFEVLKKITGGTSTEEVLQRFQSQKDTEERLTLLRRKSEEEKKKLENKLEYLNNKFDSFKYAEVKDAERKTVEMERVQAEIELNLANCKVYQEEKKQKEEALKSLGDELFALYLCINPMGIPDADPFMILHKIENSLRDILNKIQNGDISEIEYKITDLQEQQWLPPPYSGLVRGTPVSQPGTSPAPQPAGSDEEEEVPSRGYLKRQAQLVVDAKSRRKNVRIQLPKRN